MIKVLITEDSPVVRGFLEYVLNSDPDIQVVGTAKDGMEAVQMVAQNRPDVITMDIHMPKMDGFEATRKIMETNPVPIVICSASWDPTEVDKTFKTMEAGAVAALEKPRGFGHPDSMESVKELLQTIKVMSEVKVVRRWARFRKKLETPSVSIPQVIHPKVAEGKIKIIAVGTSTGGPLVLQMILTGLPKNYPVPIVVVQHIAKGFLSGLAEWLEKTTGFSVRIACQGEHILPGKVYLAPDGFQMGVDKNCKIVLSEDAPENHLKPSVSYFFRSVAKVFGKSAVGVLLTGMGKDGAQELKFIRDQGGITIVQDKESAIVYGMPGEAVRLDAATYILSPEQIAEKLKSLVEQKRMVKEKAVKF